ncbi:aromatic amino acid transaminase [Halomonas meridiana]|uniref:aromatic amino acid transaminase n=1 Tax=Vreelandella aquamarina TaxID=77097 RepID=UPI00273BA631|nr:aromatic amino acid transaminase [Halomonas meridiana]MDP4557617.1 aromatic amino acid transaminase [Halomonas meridiana]
MLETLGKISPDPILTLSDHFNQDANPRKIDLGIGLYQDESNKTPIMECVKIAEQRVIKNLSYDKKYKGSNGFNGFCEAISELLFSRKHELIKERRILSFQTIGGTGAIRLSAEIIYQINPDKGVWISNPTWDNHRDIFQHLGMKIYSYPYSGVLGELDFQSMLESISKIPEGDVIVLHGCGHNPTGFDIKKKQWAKILEIIRYRKLVPIIDMAYHGLTKSLQDDNYCIDLFSSQIDEFFIAYSCSKNFGLYNDRIGALIVVAKNRKTCFKTMLHLSRLTRLSISSPAIHGAYIINEILSSEELKEIWQRELKDMKDRTISARRILLEESKRQNCANLFFEIGYGVGLFSMISIQPKHIDTLRDKFGIYMLRSGRINISGLNEKNIKYFISSTKPFINKQY